MNGDGGLASLTLMRRSQMDIGPVLSEPGARSVRVVGAACGCPHSVGLWDRRKDRIVHKPCGSFKCQTCGPKRLAELAARIRAGLQTPEWRDPHFLTVTLDPAVHRDAAANATSRQARYGTRALRRLFGAIDADRKRKGFPRLRRINVYEWRSRSGAWHAHILLSGRLDVRSLRRRAVAAGLGRQLRIEAVKSRKRMSRYIAKYVTKRGANGKDRKPPGYSHRYSCSRDAIPPVGLWRRARAQSKHGRLDLAAPGMIGWWTGPVGETLRADVRYVPEPGRYRYLRNTMRFWPAQRIAAYMRATCRREEQAVLQALGHGTQGLLLDTG